MTDLVKVGRVGKPHGLDGSFFVEHASEDADRFVKGATLHVDGEPAEIVVSKRSRGRPVIRLDREAPRGAELAVPRDELPPAGEDEYYEFQLVGLTVEEEGGRPLGTVAAARRCLHPAGGPRRGPNPHRARLCRRWLSRSLATPTNEAVTALPARPSNAQQSMHNHLAPLRVLAS